MNELLDRLDALARGELTFRRMGRVVTSRLNATDRARLFEAIQRGYLVARESESTLHNLWSYYCGKAEIADVIAKPRSRYATVRLDLITCSRRLAKASCEALNAEFAAFGGIGSDGYVYFDRVPLSEVDRVATRLVAVGALRSKQ